MRQGRGAECGGRGPWRTALLLPLLVLLASCASMAPAPAPPVQVQPPAVVFHGQATFGTPAVLPAGATLSVSLEEQTTKGAVLVAQVGGIGARAAPVPFALRVPAGRLRPGHFYVLRARIDSASGVPLWIQPAPAPVDAGIAAGPITLWLVPAPAPRPQRPSPAPPAAKPRLGPPSLVALGRQPRWSARIYGVGAGRSLHTAVGEHDPLRQSYAPLKRQRLASGVVVYLTADGFVSLTVSPGVCRLPGLQKALSWRAVLETPAATYRGCARGIP